MVIVRVTRERRSLTFILISFCVWAGLYRTASYTFGFLSRFITRRLRLLMFSTNTFDSNHRLFRDATQLARFLVLVLVSASSAFHVANRRAVSRRVKVAASEEHGINVVIRDRAVVSSVVYTVTYFRRNARQRHLCRILFFFPLGILRWFIRTLASVLL